MDSFDVIEVFYDGVIVGELLYSINDEIFFYKVYAKDNKEQQRYHSSYARNFQQNFDIENVPYVPDNFLQTSDTTLLQYSCSQKCLLQLHNVLNLNIIYLTIYIYEF